MFEIDPKFARSVKDQLLAAHDDAIRNGDWACQVMIEHLLEQIDEIFDDAGVYEIEDVERIQNKLNKIKEFDWNDKDN